MFRVTVWLRTNRNNTHDTFERTVIFAWRPAQQRVCASHRCWCVTLHCHLSIGMYHCIILCTYNQAHNQMEHFIGWAGSLSPLLTIIAVLLFIWCWWHFRQFSALREMQCINIRHWSVNRRFSRVFSGETRAQSNRDCCVFSVECAFDEEPYYQYMVYKTD